MTTTATQPEAGAVLQYTEAALAHDLVFDEEPHTYTLDGQRVMIPCTSVVGAVDRVREVEPPDFKPIHSALGRAMHKAIELDILGELDWDTVDERIVPKVKAARGFREWEGFLPAMIQHPEGHLVPALEVFVWTPEGGAGTIDAIGWHEGALTIYDWKSSYVGGAGIQTGGYKRMVRFMFGVDVPRRMAVRHLPDETFQPILLDDPMDERRYAAGLFLMADAQRLERR